MNRGQRRAQWLAEHRNRLAGTRAAPRDFAPADRATATARTTTGAPRENTPETNAPDTTVPETNVPEIAASSVRLHIDELVLHGFPPGARYPIGDATQQELTRLLNEHGVPPRMIEAGETARVDAGSFQVKQGAPPAVVGALVANAVYGGTKR